MFNLGVLSPLVFPLIITIISFWICFDGWEKSENSHENRIFLRFLEFQTERCTEHSTGNGWDMINRKSSVCFHPDK